MGVVGEEGFVGSWNYNAGCMHVIISRTRRADRLGDVACITG
jgi:hypothetical protein